MPEYYNDFRYRQKSDIPYEKCGVADMDQSMSPVNGTPSPEGTGFRPVSTNKTYDYAEYGSHQYEELPHSRLQPSGSQMSPGSTDSRSSDNQSSAGTTVTSSDVPSDAGDTANIVRSQSQKEEEQRKRYNPLYDTMINTTPNIYNKVRVTRESVLQSQIRVLRILVIILILISCVSLCISLYLIVINSSDSSVQNLKKEISTLENKYTDLQARMKDVESVMAGNLSFEHLAKLGQKVFEIETALSSNFSSIERKMEVTTNKIDLNQGNIHAVYQNYTTSLSQMNNTVQFQLDTISKMPGPQGPPGVGNLTACFIQDYSTGSSSAEVTTETDFVPYDDDIPKTNVVMSAYCTIVNGLYTRMEVQIPSDKRSVKYKCICSGQLSGQPIRHCKINLWLCPRESFGGKG